MSIMTNPIVQRLIVSALQPVLGYLGLKATLNDEFFAAAGAFLLAAHTLWATLGLRRPDKGAQ